MTTPALVDLIARHLTDVLQCPTFRAQRLAADIENLFHLIPAAECGLVVKDYVVPADLADDEPAVEQYHAHMAAQSIAEAVVDGLLIISRPELVELPPTHETMIMLMKPFRLQATGWRLPDQDPLPEEDR
jgi:hypothetical protein